MSLLALILTYTGVAIATVTVCRLAGMVDGGCDGTQFEDGYRPFDWERDDF